MKSLDVIDAAKYEITENASTVVLNVDDVRLARWVPRLQGEGKRVRTAGSRTLDASVRVYEEARQWVVSIDGDVVTSRDPIAGVQPTNLACALAAALEIGTSIEDLTRRLSDITPIANRSNVVVAPSGVLVIDDTFNANPSSADASLALLSSLDVSGRRVVVTPGIVELGHEQYPQNLLLAQKVETFADELVIVGRTNVRALEAGYAKGAQRFDTRDEAVAWVRESLVAGDGVLYLNDLPDHYP
jgi:UDP-N-acetylmuramoyl-tripeptide--D-alanyl-D-alanine ligase